MQKQYQLRINRYLLKAQAGRKCLSDYLTRTLLVKANNVLFYYKKTLGVKVHGGILLCTFYIGRGQHENKRRKNT